MSTPPGSDPAFPLPAIQAQNGEWQNATYFGMSTRTWLAGLAMQGMLANETWRNYCFDVARLRQRTGMSVLSDVAIEAADALLLALQPSASPTHTEATHEPQKGS